jgi:hypothetical protein
MQVSAALRIAQQKQNKQIICISNFKTNSSSEAAVLEGLAA